jgi:RimJ/RimL family protein N-acetyltransferase
LSRIQSIRWPLAFHPLDEQSARAILAWRYEPPFDFYDMAPSSEEEALASLLDPQNRYFAALDAAGSLVAYRCFGADARVAGGDYDEEALDTGGGLHPELTGKGFGPPVIEAGLRLGKELFAPRAFRVTIAEFNIRALHACRSAGFVQAGAFVRPSDGRLFRMLVRHER